MNIQSTVKLVVAFCLVLFLSSCDDGKDPVPISPDLAGKVADGYLNNATVCLDLNSNGACDDDEPTTTTDGEGDFTLDATQEQIDNNDLLVIAEAGVTIDLDNPNQAIAQSYNLTAPAGYEVVTPITTLVKSLVDSGASLAEAESQIQDLLGTDLSPSVDYIAEEGEAAERLHQVAQVLTQVISRGITELTENTTDLSANAVFEQVLNTVLEDRTGGIVATIVSAVGDGSGEVDIDAIAQENRIEADELDIDEDGFTPAEGDCNDTNAAIAPNQTDIANNGIDENCDGQDTIDLQTLDADNDGINIRDGDCDDNNAQIFPGATEVPNNGVDEDCSGADLIDTSILDTDADGFTPAQGDCDDSNEAINPEATDIPNNGIDEDCQGGDLVNVMLLDTDNDGFTPQQGDCDDANPNVNPDATEIVNNGIDDNCDGEQLIDLTILDTDNDGFTPAQNDCDDNNPNINPAVVDIPNNGIDEDCDGADTFDGSILDTDNDGFTPAEGDCDDTNAAVNPDATEVPNNGLDDDCADGDLVDVTLLDQDNDGFTPAQGDCNDNNAMINPSAVEIPNNNVDEDCNGSDLVDVSLLDQDQDGFTPAQGDCDDNNDGINPGATDVPNNGVDEDCSGSDLVDDSILDNDNDGFSPAQGDCNDDNDQINPDATDIPNNGIDEDCQGGDLIDLSLVDGDQDGFTPAQGDCDDDDPAINPDATDIPNNGVDEDCSGEDLTDPNLIDADNDMFTPAQGDCDDTDPGVNPGVEEIDGNGIDDNCDNIIDFSAQDNDRDNFTVEAGDCNDDDPTIFPGAESIPNNGIDEDCDGADPIEATAVNVRILSPESLTTVGVTPITVTGNVDTANVETTVNGISVTPDQNGDFSVEVDIEEGHNVIVLRGTTDSLEVTDSISVSLDLTPPFVTIESHDDGATVFTDEITVTGLINDIVRGTVEESQATVTVNGKSAEISNRSYSAKQITLSEGQNTITVSGTDQVGNVGEATVSLTYEVPQGRQIQITGGQEQTGTIQSVLAEPLEVTVLNDDLEPVEDAVVVYRIAQGSGFVAADTDSEGRAVVVETDANGVASTPFRVGVRVGVANQKVTATVVGYDSVATFTASVEGGIGDKLSINSGNNQRGGVGQLLPEPLVVAVTDVGANVVAGARVLFEVTAGAGELAGPGSTEFGPSFEATTDTDGRASAEYRLGFLEGLDAQRISVTLLDAPTDGEGNTVDITAGFQATAFVPADAGDTSISGVVLDNFDEPIPGVTVLVEGSNRQAIADAEGQFLIENVPVGPVHLVADGSTATVEGEFPSLSYNIVTVSGVENPLAAPIYMVKLDTDGAVSAGSVDAVLTLEDFPGFQLDIAANSATFPDGSTSGLVSATAVNASKVPMAPPNGMQPQFIVTIQPTGTRFDPPARLTLPNVDGHAAGAQVEMYSYDHDLEEFVSIGLGTVSEDSSVIQSNKGVGVIKAGWHCGSQPGGSGCCKKSGGCGACYEATGECGENCRLVPDRTNPDQIVGNCRTELCSGSRINNGDIPDGDCGTCENGSPVIEEGRPKSDDAQVDNDCKTLLCGGDFEPADETAAVQVKQPCLFCSEGEKENVANGTPCGDGTPAQACYTCDTNCIEGTGCDRDAVSMCANHCDASNIKNKVENTLPNWIVGRLDSVGNIVNSSPIFNGNIEPFVETSVEFGEQCCANCATPGPQDYTKYTGTAGVQNKGGPIQVTVPGLGVAYEFPKEETSFLGFSVKGKAFITAAGASIEIKAFGEVSYTDTDCPGENCGSFRLAAELATTIGPQVDLSVALLDCEDPKCDENTTIIGAQGKASIGLDIKATVQAKASSGASCGKSCIGFVLDPITGAAKGSLSFEFLFKKWTISGSTSPITFYSGFATPGC